MDTTNGADGGARMVGPATRPRRCIVGRLLDRVSDADRDLILSRLNADPFSTGWTDAALSDALRRGGHRASRAALSLHRLGRCSCDRLNATENVA